jgi:hypothetical protein
LICSVLGCWLLLAGSALAQSAAPGEAVSPIDPIDIPPENDPLAHAWDRPDQRGGFYLRGLLSIGVHTARIGPPNWENGEGGGEARGFGSGFGLDLGGFIAPWVALHLDAQAGVLWSGDYESDLAVAAYEPDDMRVATYGLAPAATFFVPHDFFFTTAFGVGLAHKQAGDSSTTTNPGFFMNLAVGNDLYTSRNLAVGIQMQVVYTVLGDDQTKNDVRSRQFLFGVSVAYDSI